MSNITPCDETVLVVGASGLVGTAAVNAFYAAGWNVVAASRRAPVFLDEGIEGNDRYQHLALDLMNAEACTNAISQLPQVTHVVYTAVYELPGLIAGWADPKQIETNGQMLRNLMQPLLSTAQVQHITILQGTKAYGATVKPMRVPGRESQVRVEHPNFYWLQEDYIKDLCANYSLTYTILRPQLIVGPNYGVVMNLPPVIGAYAALRQAEGLPFSYPGGADWVWEAADTRLVANACVWAANHSAAANETFNLTNGEVFSWRDMWPALADTLGVEVGPDEPNGFADYFSSRQSLWGDIVAAHNLQPISLDELLGESHFYADMCFNVGAETSPPPTFLSTVKAKQAGFTDTWHTEESFCHWLKELQHLRIIPNGK